MYEAVYRHALLNNHDQVEGGEHSDDAGYVHESLARDHDLNYSPGGSSEPERPRGPYSYSLRRSEGGLSPGGKVLEGVLEAAQLLMILNKAQTGRRASRACARHTDDDPELVRRNQQALEHDQAMKRAIHHLRQHSPSLSFGELPSGGRYLIR